MRDDPGKIADWLEARGRVIAFVGAGGKTTLLYALAQEEACRGRTSIIMTTTHIWRPDFLPLAEDPADLRRLLGHNRLVVYGRRQEDGKLAPPPEEAGSLRGLADFVWVEADGSRGLPCKVPAAHEPVLPEAAQTVVAVLGLQAVGRPLAEACCRSELAQGLLAKPGAASITEEDLACILGSGQGARKDVGSRNYAAVLHQCDSEEDEKSARRIRKLLAGAGVPDVFCTSRCCVRGRS